MLNLKKLLVLVVAQGSLFGACALSAQTSAQPSSTATPGRLAFEVASIRPHEGPLSVIAGFTVSGPHLKLEGYNFRYLVQEAYNLRNYKVSFAVPKLGPDEDGNSYYNIAAAAEGESSRTREEFRQMLQTLLADRFKLRFHHEMKEMQVYALVVAKNGPKFKQSAADAIATGFMGVHGRNQTATLTRTTMDSLAGDIEGSFGPRFPVIDRTGLSGFYDLKLEATPEYRINNNSQPEDIRLFDAVQDQLGLKLEVQKAMVDVLVVDYIEKPSAN